MMADTVFAIIDFRAGRITHDDLVALFKRRARIAGHLVDSATFLFLEPQIVIETFPRARYFFALRPCEEWIISMVDRFNTLYRMKRAGVRLDEIRDMDRFGTIFSPRLNPDVFSSVSNIQLHAQELVRDLAQIWSRSVIRVMEAMLRLPAEQRLVIHLKDMNQSLEIFAKFSGVPLHTLDTRYTHINKDTHAKETRAVLGEEVIRREVSSEQLRVDQWLAEHPGFLTVPRT